MFSGERGEATLVMGIAYAARFLLPLATARRTPDTRWSLPITANKLFARGFPLGPNIRIKLFEGVPVAFASFSNPTVALM